MAKSFLCRDKPRGVAQVGCLGKHDASSTCTKIVDANKAHLQVRVVSQIHGVGLIRLRLPLGRKISPH